RQFLGKPCDRALRGDHVLPIAAIEAEAGHLLRLARKEIPAPARVAASAIAAVPADADALPRSPFRDSLSDGVDRSGHLVTRHARVGNARKEPFLDDRIAMADSAGLDLDANVARPRIRDRSLDDLERLFRRRDLCNAHGLHDGTS